MKRLFFIMVAWLLALLPTMAQDAVSFQFSNSLADATLRQHMEQQTTRLLTEINAAATAKRPLQLQGISITQQATQALARLWNLSAFKCDDTEMVQRCLQDVSGYEARGIAVTMLNKAIKGNKQRELIINYTKDGIISSAHMAIEGNDDSGIFMQNCRDLTDERRRFEIINFVDKFRSYYDEKDTAALREIFSDNALIITGRVITHKTYEGDMPKLKQEIVYKKQSKEQYMNNLKKTFKKNKYIHLTFEDIKIYAHKSKPRFYGVSLNQNWQSDTYNDDGYLFLLWEFFDDDRPPVITVRTWQPDKVDGKKLDESQRASMDDYIIP